MSDVKTTGAISIGVLHQLGYRVCHAKNVAKAIQTLKRVKAGTVLHTEIDQAIAALEHGPLTQSTAVTVIADNTEAD